MNNRFIYDENTSRLYAPDGRFLKRVFCPKAKTWNQLVADDPGERMRGCADCRERVLNLDVVAVADALSQLGRRGDRTCVHASEAADRVIFLRAEAAPPPIAAALNRSADGLVIRTARGVKDINRAATLGYWPDVRLIEFDTESVRSKFQLIQHTGSGRVEVRGDYRAALCQPSDPVDDLSGGVRVSGRWSEVIPFTDYYPNYQGGLPIAAYLIPPDIPEGSEVLVEDPIEDIVGQRWNQGSAYRATRVQGYIRNRRVVIERGKVSVSEFIG
jgi:hypothetical protein